MPCCSTCSDDVDQVPQRPRQAVESPTTRVSPERRWSMTWRTAVARPRSPVACSMKIRSQPAASSSTWRVAVLVGRRQHPGVAEGLVHVEGCSRTRLRPADETLIVRRVEDRRFGRFGAAPGAVSQTLVYETRRMRGYDASRRLLVHDSAGVGTEEGAGHGATTPSAARRSGNTTSPVRRRAPRTTSVRSLVQRPPTKAPAGVWRGSGGRWPRPRRQRSVWRRWRGSSRSRGGSARRQGTASVR
jgi:hypothetical protein